MVLPQFVRCPKCAEQSTWGEVIRACYGRRAGIEEEQRALEKRATGRRRKATRDDLSEDTESMAEGGPSQVATQKVASKPKPRRAAVKPKRKAKGKATATEIEAELEDGSGSEEEWRRLDREMMEIE